MLYGWYLRKAAANNQQASRRRRRCHRRLRQTLTAYHYQDVEHPSTAVFGIVILPSDSEFSYRFVDSVLVVNRTHMPRITAHLISTYLS